MSDWEGAVVERLAAVSNLDLHPEGLELVAAGSRGREMG